jgi:polyisoprenyl-phosphate glycosyltransferase
MSSRSSVNFMAQTEAKPTVSLSVCIPVYNEKEALRGTIVEMQEVLDPLGISYEIIVIDDCSTDGCLETVRDLPIRVIRHRRNLGGGIGRLNGIRYARGQLILQTDADGTYPCDKVPEMLERLQHADMVIGARKRESATDWRWLRALMKNLLKGTASFLSGQKIPDLNSGMRAYHRDASLRYAHLYPRSHSMMSTMTLGFISDGLKVDFVAIDYHVRIGKSSFRPIRDTYNYFLTIFRTVCYFDPLRLLMPVVIGLGLVAAAFTIRNLLLFVSFGSLPPLLWLVDLILLVLAFVADQFARISRQIAFQNPVAPYHRDVVEEPWGQNSG